MRRALASLLLAALSFPLIALALLADAGGGLAACCRRNGKHRCAMPETSALETASAGPIWQAVQQKCPLYPQAGPIRSYSKNTLLSATPRIGAPNVFHLAIASPSDARPHAVSPESVRKRGPPAVRN